jgi:prepilin-type N-terminal cleavage/methylation domain-containing protein
MINRKQKGSTLIEVLVASIIFALGILGISGSLGKGVHSSLDNNARAIASSVATQVVEPLYLAASNLQIGVLDESEFIDVLVEMNEATVTGNDGRDDFTINILEARDSDDLDVLANAPPFSSPIRVVIEVGYEGLKDVKTTRSTYTFVW